MRATRGFGICFPGYNWCGPGCSGPGAPVNELDAMCMEHDACYRSGANRYLCDQHFVRDLSVKMNPYTQEGRHARTMYNFMKMKMFFHF